MFWGSGMTGGSGGNGGNGGERRKGGYLRTEPQSWTRKKCRDSGDLPEYWQKHNR